MGLQLFCMTSIVASVNDSICKNGMILQVSKMLEILDDDEYYDITIEVGNDPHVKIFRANMAILNYRSPFLQYEEFYQLIKRKVMRL